jgi:hypothetical protein
MNFLDITGDLDLINLDLVRSIRIKDFKKVIGLTFVYSDGSEDLVTVPPGRWAVLEDILLELRVEMA